MLVSVQLKGLVGLLEKTTHIENGIAPAIRDATEKSERYLLQSIPPAPPSRPTYVRTGLLEGNFTGKVTPVSGGFAASVSNPTEYAPWVISDSSIGGAGPQASVHRGRWYTVQQVLRKATEGITRIYQTELGRLLDT